jgi:glutamine amidotransferase
MSCVIINYGMGNLASVSKALRKIGVAHSISAHPEEVMAAHTLVLPGVGSFQAAMENLNSSGLSDAIRMRLGSGDAKLLGICLGMQLLADTGFEPERCSGLGLIPGEVRALECDLPVPHMGWNNLDIKNPTYFGELEDLDFYFVHSYHFVPQNEADIAATTDYGGPVVAAVQRGPVFGCQFHPEKSQRSGLKVLEHFFAPNA